MSKDLAKLKVAIVHDWLIGGGAERVVLELHRIFPEAPIFTSFATQEWRDRLDGRVITGALQKWPWSKLRKFVPPLRIWWFGRLKLRGYDLVISSSGAEAKGIKVPAGTLHVNYCHAPTHYYWARFDEYLKQPGFGVFDPLARLGLKLLVGPLRRWDRRAAQRPHHMLANSTFTAAEIRKYYGRDSTVLHPPIDVERFAKAGGGPRHGFVITGRQTPYKRVDLAVAACSQLNLPLKVIGNGPEHQRLVKLAGPSVSFLTDVSDADLPGHLAGALAFIFPGIDDFGISPVEAQAAGTPVIAYHAGGALDYVIPDKTGLFFGDPPLDSLELVLAGFAKRQFDSQLIQDSAAAFGPSVFKQQLVDFLQKIMV